MKLNPLPQIPLSRGLLALLLANLLVAMPMILRLYFPALEFTRFNLLRQALPYLCLAMAFPLSLLVAFGSRWLEPEFWRANVPLAQAARARAATLLPLVLVGLAGSVWAGRFFVPSATISELPRLVLSLAVGNWIVLVVLVAALQNKFSPWLLAAVIAALTSGLGTGASFGWSEELRWLDMVLSKVLVVGAAYLFCLARLLTLKNLRGGLAFLLVYMLAEALLASVFAVYWTQHAFLLGHGARLACALALFYCERRLAAAAGAESRVS